MGPAGLGATGDEIEIAPQVFADEDETEGDDRQIETTQSELRAHRRALG